MCKDRGIKLIDIASEGGVFRNDAKMHMNRSTSAFDEITLGIYTKPELRVISFFHELGHIDDQQNKRLPEFNDLPYYHFDEASAWRTGLELASEAGIKFSEDAVMWAMDQLNTYFTENPNAEKTDIKYLQEAITYAFENVKVR